MNTRLAQFQDDFARALLAPEAGSSAALVALTCQPGFAVYRNTVMKGWIEALQANYPAVTQLVGDEWMRAAAAIYARAHPPQDARMLYYGENFAEFLAGFEPAAALPYLPDVARLDRYWTECHAAPDQPALDPDALASLAPDALAGAVLHPHASARWAYFTTGPAYSIWAANRNAQGDHSELAWRAEGALLVRSAGNVEWCMLDAPGCAFMDACNKGEPLAHAAAAALAVQDDADLAQLLARLLSIGGFSRHSLMSEQA